MNFISEVINIVSENEIADARSSLKKLLKEIKNFQTESQTYIDENYIEFSNCMTNNGVYLSQAEHLSKEVEKLVETIETDTKSDLLSVAEDVQQYLSELDELRIGLRLNKRILSIDELFTELDEIKSSQQFMRIRAIIKSLHELIFDGQDEEIFKRLDCYKNIKIRWHIENEMLLNTLQDRFDALVQMSEKTFQNSKCITVKISKNTEALKEILAMLFETNFNTQRICTFLMNNIFEPIITKPVSLDVNDKDEPTDGTAIQFTEEFTTITSSFSTKSLVTNDIMSLRPNYKIVFKNLCRALTCLRALVINHTSIYKILANNIGERFFKLIINECLTYAIPDTIDDMSTSTLVVDVKNFDGFLQTIDFRKDDGSNNHLIDFSERIDVIFKKRFCLNILKSAVAIMHKDLHDMQIVDETKGAFPRCMVSRSTFELIDLMEKVLKEAIDAVENAAAKSLEAYIIEDIQERLRSTIPMILERYLTEVVEAHGKLLQTIPQQTALFHNNCLYLAWWLGKIECMEDSPIQLDRSNVLILELQELGSKQFALQINNQRSQLLEILKEFDLSDSIIELGPQPLKIIRQCLRQLDLLKNVWQTILPDAVYNKTMGTIVNDFCDEIIRKILAREDISSAVANGLVNICDTIIERAPAIFEVRLSTSGWLGGFVIDLIFPQDPLQISVHVKQWTKLQQMKMILNASMVQIVEQWADGKGPLTLNFNAEDIRHLIRALFQNTDRRATVLASIV